MNSKNDYIETARQIIISLGLPRAQQNERSASLFVSITEPYAGQSLG